MHSFKDTAERSWNIRLSINAVMRIRAELGIDLLAVDDKGMAELMTRHLSDPVTVMQIVYCIIRPEVQAADVSADQFTDALAGDAIEAAQNAFVEELADFFPSPRARLAFRAMLAKARQVGAILVDRAMTKIAGLDPEVLATATLRLHSGQAMDPTGEKAASTHGDSSGASPASSESIQVT